jgi:hypothetical protein
MLYVIIILSDIHPCKHFLPKMIAFLKTTVMETTVKTFFVYCLGMSFRHFAARHFDFRHFAVRQLVNRHKSVATIRVARWYILKTKNNTFGAYLKALEWKLFHLHSVYFVAIWYTYVCMSLPLNAL